MLTRRRARAYPRVDYESDAVALDRFEPTALIPGDEPGSYAEIELRWPHGSGGIIIRTWDRPAPNWLYVVTPDPDGPYQRVKAAGLEITRELQDTDHGNRTFTVVGPVLGQLELRDLPRQLTGTLTAWHPHR